MLSFWEPSDVATFHFTLHEWKAIKVLEPLSEWSKSERCDGKTG